MSEVVAEGAEDPRRVRTRAALGAALLRRLSDAPLEAISVAQLCRDAGIHRTTFYGHARDVDEFAIEFVSRDIDAVSTVDISDDLNAEEAARRYFGALVRLLRHVAEERVLFRPLLASRSGAALRLALQHELTARVLLALRVFSARGHPGAPAPDAHAETAAFLAPAIVGFISEWAASDDTDADAAARRMLALMPAWWPIR